MEETLNGRGLAAWENLESGKLHKEKPSLRFPMAIADIFAGLLVTVLGFGLGTQHKSHGSLLTYWEGNFEKAPSLTECSPICYLEWYCASSSIFFIPKY